MMDALLFAVRDGIRAAGYGYGTAECEIMGNGQPPVPCGNIFVAVHSGAIRSTASRNLDEYFSFLITLTMRISVPIDRVGDQLLASKLLRSYGKRNPSLESRAEQLRGLLHMNWNITVVQGRTPNSANDNIAAWTPDGSVYGFIEPPRYVGQDKPELVGGEWFGENPMGVPEGLKCEMRFEAARRMQPQTLAVGPYG